VLKTGQDYQTVIVTGYSLNSTPQVNHYDLSLHKSKLVLYWTVHRKLIASTCFRTNPDQMRTSIIIRISNHQYQHLLKAHCPVNSGILPEKLNCNTMQLKDFVVLKMYAYNDNWSLLELLHIFHQLIFLHMLGIIFLTHILLFLNIRSFT